MKNFRKFRKNVKAISPVLSVLMMIAVAVAASLVTYAWVMGYLGFTTAKVGKAIQIQSIGIETGNLKVYVQNVGDSAVMLQNATCLYVDGVQQTTAIATYTGTSLQKGDTSTISVAVFTVTQGHSYVVRVVTQDGTFTEATKTFS
jgi:flagellin-like protein